jgi:hypothetical protein
MSLGFDFALQMKRVTGFSRMLFAILDFRGCKTAAAIYFYRRHRNHLLSFQILFSRTAIS